MITTNRVSAWKWPLDHPVFQHLHRPARRLIVRHDCASYRPQVSDSPANGVFFQQLTNPTANYGTVTLRTTVYCHVAVLCELASPARIWNAFKCIRLGQIPNCF